MLTRNQESKLVRRLLCAAAMAGSLSTMAQARPNYPETEGNSSRATANLIPSTGLPTPGMQPGEAITGTTTGTSTTVTTTASADYFRVRIGTAAPGIYEQKLTATNGGTQSYSLTLRGYDTADNLTIDTASDVSVTFSSSSANPRYVQWYGFGKGEEVIFRIDGASGTTAAYSATLSRTPIVPDSASTVFSAGPITVTTIGVPDVGVTDFWVYDSNFEPVATFGNDDATALGGATSTSGSQSLATRILAPGTYYVAISTFNLANDQPHPFDEDASSIMNVWSTPNAISNSATSTNVNLSFKIIDAAGNIETVPATKLNAYDVVWKQFTVGPAATIGIAPAATPSPVTPGVTTLLLTNQVTAAPVAPNTITSVTVGLADFDGPSSQIMYDDGSHGDVTPGDGIYSFALSVPLSAPPGYQLARFSVSDSGGRTVSYNVPVTVTPAVPVNDTCATATTVSEAMFPFTDVVGASLATDDPNVTCGFTGGMAFKGIWYTYTPAVDGILSVYETNDDGDVDAAITYYGSCDGIELACDNTETDSNIPVTAGVPMYILVSIPSSIDSNAIDPNDSYHVTIKSAPKPTAPANDVCSGATNITPDGNFIMYPSGGANHEPRSSCQTLSTQPFEARNGIWLTYLTGSDDVLGRFSRQTNDIFTSMQVFASVDGTCDNLVEQSCTGLPTGTTGTAIPMRKNTRYFFMLHRTSGYMAADGSYEVRFAIETPPQVPNKDCTTATVVTTMPFSDSQFQMLAFNDRKPSCDTTSASSPQARNGVWYEYTPTVPQQIRVLETGSVDSLVSAFEGSCGGTQVLCNTFESDTTGTSNLFNAQANVTYYIMVSRDSTTFPVAADQYAITLSATNLPAVPTNDLCANAIDITAQPLPYADTQPIGSATSDREASCLAVGLFTANSGVWYKYTNGASASAAVIGETSSMNASVTTYRGSCDGPEVQCNFASETNNYVYMLPNETYFFCVHNSAPALTLAADQVSFSFNLFTPVTPPPANDDCITATAISRLPFNSVFLPLGANDEFDIACSSTGVRQSTQGTWYKIDLTTTTGATITVTETGSSDVMYALYNGTCATLLEEQCKTADTNQSFTIGTSGPYYLLVARENTGSDDFITTNVAFNLTITAPNGTSGACCNGSTCTTTMIENCSTGFIPGGSCSPTDPCAPISQFCCRGTTCNPVASGTCTGSVAGSSSVVVASCGAGNSSATCCFADFNHTGGTTIDDLFLYLNAYFTSSPYANFGGDTVANPTIDDLFLYINAYFTGCQP